MHPPRKLKDIPVAPSDLLERLAALKPPAPPKDAGHGKDRGEKSRPGANHGAKKSTKRRKSNDLGPLNVTAYLVDHNIIFSEKTDDRGTIFQLRECLFDPAHGPNEASIIQYQSGALYYQCFHDSCKGHTWADARQKVSGDKSLAPWMEGYDPRYQRSGRAPAQDQSPAAGKNTAVAAQDSRELVCTPYTMVDAPLVPPPHEVSTWEFFIEGNKGMKYVPAKLARYLGVYLQPMVHTAQQFWRYHAGVWAPYPDSRLFQIATHCLKDMAAPARINSAIELLRGLLNQEEEDWPIHENFVNAKNGMIDLKALFRGDDLDTILKPHSHEYGSRAQLAAAYDPDQLPDDFLRVLMQIFPGKDEAGKIILLQEAFGYALWPSCRYETSFFFHGAGSNGKGTVSDALEQMLGRDNCSSLSIGDLQEKFRVYFLQGKMANISGENPERESLSTDNFKRAVSGESLMAERKYGEVYKFIPFAKFFFSFNSAPIIQDKSYGFERRVAYFEFKQRFEGKNKDTSIRDEQLMGWTTPLLTWALGGLSQLYARGGFFSNEGLVKDKARFMGQLNPVLEFCKQRVEFGPGRVTSSKLVYDDYKAWAEAAGQRKLSQIRFNEQITINYPHVIKTRDKQTRRFVFTGMELLPQG